MDAAENARMNGTTDVRTETSPASYPQYAAGVSVEHGIRSGGCSKKEPRVYVRRSRTADDPRFEKVTQA
jgi:hypothetical protein